MIILASGINSRHSKNAANVAQIPIPLLTGQSTAVRYVFDQFELDTDCHHLLDSRGIVVPLRPQAFRVLAYLIEHSPSVVSRAELLAGVWGHDALSASGVSQAIREIRRALGDDAAQPRILATRHGCGYQIVTPVVKAQPSGRESGAGQKSPSLSAVALLAILGILLIGLGAGAYWSRPATDPPFPGQARWLHYDSEQRGLPTNPAALDAFRAGERYRRHMDWIRAIERFSESLEIEPDASATLFGLIDAYSRAGFDRKARTLIEQPEMQLASLTRREQLEVRALVSRFAGDWAEVAHGMRSLTDFFPQYLEYRFGLFEALLVSQPPEKAESALRSLREMLPEGQPGTRYFLALQALHERRHQPAEALAAAHQALQAAEASDADSLKAHAQLALGRALARTDERAQARKVLMRSATTMRRLFNDAGYAEALGELARLDLRENRIDAARKRIAQACEISSRIGDSSGMAQCATDEAEVLMKAGKHTESESLLRDALIRYEQLGYSRQAKETHLLLTQDPG